MEEAKRVLLTPNEFIGDCTCGKLAEELIIPVEIKFLELKVHRAPFMIYGENEIDEESKRQLSNALRLPISVQGALMPMLVFVMGFP